MSGAAEEDPNATKAVVDDEKNGDKTEPEKKPAASMEGEDEWEEFPQQDWADEDQELPGGNIHLWEAGWDDDDANNEFSKQLKDVDPKIPAVDNSNKKNEKKQNKKTNKPTEKSSKRKRDEDDSGEEDEIDRNPLNVSKGRYWGADWRWYRERQRRRSWGRNYGKPGKRQKTKKSE